MSCELNRRAGCAKNPGANGAEVERADARDDERIAWQFTMTELSISGQNLASARHPKFGTRIPSSIPGRITWRL